jgi:hypothetical protein
MYGVFFGVTILISAVEAASAWTATAWRLDKPTHELIARLFVWLNGCRPWALNGAMNVDEAPAETFVGGPT